MKNLLTLGMALAAMTALANKNGSEESVKTKQDVPLEYNRCRATYDEIREQLLDGEITIEEAQKLWLEHRKNEQTQTF